jgi:DNA-directed RNA polymerase specialized sigma subunit
MPYKKKKKGGRKSDQIDVTVVQWLNKETDRYQKIVRATGEVISEKVTPGPYKNFHVVTRRPRRRPELWGDTPKPTKKKTAKKKTKKKKAKKKVKKKARKKNYLNNKDLLAEVLLSKENDPPKMTNKLAKMLQMLCARYGSRGQFAGYTYNEDMQAYAMMMLVRTWNSFNPEKSNNPFAFFTQCVKNSFIQYLNSEKRHRTIRDELMVNEGLNPSYTYQLEHEAKNEEKRKQLHEERENPLEAPRETKKDELLEY